MKKALKFVLLATAIGVASQWLAPRLALAATCALKTWSSGAGVMANDLNGNFSCINALTQSLSDANITPGAAIQYTKLQGLGSLVSRSWGFVNPTCSINGACTVAANVGVTSVSRSAQGVYLVTMTATRADANFALFANAYNAGDDLCVPNTIASGGGNNSFLVDCFVASSGAAVDVPFNFMTMDDETGTGGF